MGNITSAMVFQSAIPTVVALLVGGVLYLLYLVLVGLALAGLLPIG